MNPTLVNIDQDLSQRIVTGLLGDENPYVSKVVSKYINLTTEELTQICTKSISQKYTPISKTLTTQIENAKNDLTDPQNQMILMVNSILKEKLMDRSNVEASTKHKIFLGILSFVLPIITFVVQYVLTVKLDTHCSSN